MPLHRRTLLASAAWLAFGAHAANALEIFHLLPWAPNAGTPPQPVHPGPWAFFNNAEGRTVEAIADRIIPPDSDTPGGKEAGCAVFIDRQLAGSYGQREGLYVQPPFRTGTKNQGPQSADGPAQQYRNGLAALDGACAAAFAGKQFVDLSEADKDAVLRGVETGAVKLDGADGPAFFERLIEDMRMGFFADPLYGGNRDMVGWKMIGFPGARYNYLDWIDRHNERFPLPPVGMTGRAEWTPKR